MNLDASVFDFSTVDIHVSLDAKGEPDRDIVAGDYVRHFKGNIYRVMTLATETEETGIVYVVYEDMASSPRKVWCRPYRMFMSEVDRTKYPDATQKYRFEKVWLSKKVRDYSTTVFEYTPDTELQIVEEIRKFFQRCNTARYERIQIWQAIERPVNINEFRPAINRLFIGPMVNIKLNHEGPKTIVVSNPIMRTTIHLGDVLHFSENRMVLEDRKCREHDFFEIVPDALD